VPSLISYSELSLPIPQARQLWLTTSPEDWKRTFFEVDPEGQVPRISLIDCLRDPSRTASCPGLYDAGYAQIITLYALSSLIRENRQSQSVFPILKGTNARASLLVNEVQRRELLEMIEVHRCGLEYRENDQSPSHMLILNLLYLHLFVSVEQVELVAGKDGIAEAQATCPLLKLWRKTQDAREAAWHAGQVVRAFSQLRRDDHTIFNAVALYHASLCIWLYGILSSQKSVEVDDTPKYCPQSGEVQLDGKESLNTRQWVRLDCGLPTLSGFSVTTEQHSVHRIPISLPSTILSKVIQMMMDKYQGQQGSVPPFVERIVALSSRLQQAGTAIIGRFL
jgi:hypothetical protein